jgi:maltose 6'-phosphate phosphatase
VQSRDALIVSQQRLLASGYRAPTDVTLPIGQDHYALALAEALCRAGRSYHWCYLPIKLGYGKYDEGVALLWRGEAESLRVLQLSDTRDYGNWRRRMALGVQLDGTWFYSVHTSRWDDPEEPFITQWQRLRDAVQAEDRVFLLGDFNCPADAPGQGYARMMADGWQDLFVCSGHSEGYRTVRGVIDGWKDASADLPRRIDYILCKIKGVSVPFAKTLFDVDRGQRPVSDHCGVMCEVYVPNEKGEGA